MTTNTPTRFVTPFNGPIEIGLRALTILVEAFPRALSLQRLVVFDYLLVHSDDLPDGPPGLHPKTPHRGGELLVRRQVLQDGLSLYRSRGLVEQRFGSEGVLFIATESSAGFLDVLASRYAHALRERAIWLHTTLGLLSDARLEVLAKESIGDWGAEFTMESVLWGEEPE